MKKNWLRAAALLLTGISLFANGGAILAKTVVKTDVTNYFQQGIVDIELEEYEKRPNGKEGAFTDNQTILPGSTISKIPRVKNEAVDCYIRLKVSHDGGQLQLTDDDILGWNKDLRKVGEYYYYTKVLEHGKSFDVFKEVKIPPEWTSAVSGKDIKIRIDVDAIQSRNFVPSFASSNPWGNIEIENCLYEDGYNFTKFKKGQDSKLEVYLTEKADQLVHAPDDFFTRFGYVLPGDTLSDSISLNNMADKPMALYFGTSKIENGGTLDQMELTITIKRPDGSSDTVYEGKMNTDLQYRLLGTFQPGQEGELLFTIHVPEWLTNKYALDTGMVKWLFMAEFEDNLPKKTPDPDTPPTPTETATAEESVQGATNIPPEGVAGALNIPSSHLRKTGDTGLTPYVIAFAVSAVAFVLIYGRKRKGGKS